MIVQHRRGPSAPWHDCNISDRSIVARAVDEFGEFDDGFGNEYREAPAAEEAGR